MPACQKMANARASWLVRFVRQRRKGWLGTVRYRRIFMSKNNKKSLFGNFSCNR